MNQENIKKAAVRLNDSSSSSLTDVHTEFAELSKILNNLETKYTNSEKQYKSTLEENKKIKAQYNSLMLTLKSRNSALTEEHSKTSILNEKITNLEMQLRKASTNFDDTNRNYNKLLKENSQLNLEIKRISEELNKQKNECNRISVENSIIPKLNQKLAKTETQLKEFSKKLEEKTAYCNQILEKNSKIPELNDEISTLKLQLKQITNRLNTQNSKLSEENSKIPILNVKLENLKEHLKQTSLELENEISKCTQLSLDNEGLDDKCKELAMENSSLRAKQDEADQTILELNHNVNIVEQKLKHVTTELEKEIAECTQLMAENQKLKSLKDGNELESEKLNLLSLDLEIEIAKNTALTEYNKQLDGLIRGLRSTTQLEKVTPGSKESLRNSQEKLNDRNNGKVLIRDLPTDQILEPLENTVIVLASKMSMCINREDVVNVRIMERKGLSEFCQNVSLLVEFKTSDTKSKFLSSRNKLKLNSSTKFIQLKDFVENEIYSLFLYANKNLRDNGFNRIWCKDNQVLAIKNDVDTEIIEIKSRNHVDELIKPNWRS
ncbi:putative leucine-rich repeat-containing protein DDB_G0290503 [Calliphora vicina]|uniref:putative leucine-rich repeat-containing protein DDB_G0290503 n=1 Tax=Calliphora vicina TaxID=7373 RepID=UPI00325C2A0D